MNTKTLKNFNRFGKIGKIVITVLFVAAVVTTLLTCVATVYVATLPKDAVKITVTKQAEFKINESRFSSIWGMLSNGFSYATESDPSYMLKNDSSNKILPEENTELRADLKFFNQTYSSATIRSEAGSKMVHANSAPEEYCSSDLVTLLVFLTLFVASVAVALWLLQRLFKVLSVCESPFCSQLVLKLKSFGYSLLPMAALASIGETLAVRFLSAGQSTGICIQWGALVAFAVTMCLVAVFRYGVLLQKESDETL